MYWKENQVTKLEKKELFIHLTENKENFLENPPKCSIRIGEISVNLFCVAFLSFNFDINHYYL